MNSKTFGGYKNIDLFVDAKLRKYEKLNKDFDSLFEMMFAERENVMYEESRGYRITKTTYGEAYDNILHKAYTLQGLLSDVPTGSVVGLYMNNSLSWIENFWCILMCGYKPLLMNMRLSDSTLEDVIIDCKVCAVISDSKQFGVKTILSDDIIPDKTHKIKDYKFADEIFVMSSGTSSHVKVCAYTAEEFYHQIKGSYSIIKESKSMKKHYKGELKQLTFLPFYHIFGLVAVYIWFAFFSRTFVQLNDMSPQTIVNTIKKHKVTHIFAVPLFWEKVYAQAIKTVKQRGEKTYKKLLKGLSISKKLENIAPLSALFSKIAFGEVRENMFGDSICFMITGGSHIRSEVIEFFNSIGYHLANGYGMTEIGITSVELSNNKATLNSCSVGKPMTGVEYKISEHGTLLVRSKAMAKYIIEAGKRYDSQGWFDTSDLASYEHGVYKILGRKDDLIIAPNGENLNPNIIEHQLNMDGIKGVCIVGQKKNGISVPTLIVSINKHTPEEVFELLKKRLRQRISELNLSGQISSIFFTTSELMTATEFKINRTRILSDLSSGKLTPFEIKHDSSNIEGDEISSLIRNMFAVALSKPAEQIGYDSDFFLDEGGSSLDYFAMISQLQSEFDISFPSDSEKSMNTIRELHEYIKGALKNACQILE